MRCLTAKAFEYWIEPHLTRARSDRDRKLMGSRVARIINMLVLSRNVFSKTIVDDDTGAEEQVGGEIPEARIVTQDLRFTPAELDAYRKREARCADYFVGDLTPENVTELGDEEQQKRFGSKVRQGLGLEHSYWLLRVS
jgi:hypothetical protein